MRFSYRSPLGTLTIVVEKDNVVFISFDGKTTRKIPHTNNLVKKIQSQLDAYFAGSLKSFSLPMELTGTPFQMKVWKYLQSIPYGKTMSYQAVAKAIGHPRSARAVGTACKHNPIPVIIPCHRIVRSDGTIGAYVGGAKVKKYLLQLEGVIDV